MKAPTLVILLFLVTASYQVHGQKQVVKAVYIPLADHYAGVVAYEKYRTEMDHADYRIERMRNWPLLRARFMSGEADMAFVMCPMAMDMFREKPNFRWVGLMHRDGNAMAVNDLVGEQVMLPPNRTQRKPDAMIADAFAKFARDRGRPIECGVPDLLATHTVALYKYMKDQGKTLGVGFGARTDLVAIPVAPSKAPAFIKKRNSRGIPAAFEQSLPWADVVETGGYGKVAWYSKDVLPWNNGHVECIILVTDDAIRNKNAAIGEVIRAIHRSGLDIEAAREKGGDAIQEITNMVRRHIPEHNPDAIAQSLRLDLNVINYRNLNIDVKGLKMIMDLAVEGGILKKAIDIEAFADDQFSTELTLK